MDFFIDLSRVANRAGNLLAQERGVPPAQAVDQCLDRAHTNLERRLPLARKKVRPCC